MIGIIFSIVVKLLMAVWVVYYAPLVYDGSIEYTPTSFFLIIVPAYIAVRKPNWVKKLKKEELSAA